MCEGSFSGCHVMEHQLKGEKHTVGSNSCFVYNCFACCFLKPMGYFNVRSLWPQNPHVAGSRGVSGAQGRRSWPCGNRMLPAGVGAIVEAQTPRRQAPCRPPGPFNNHPLSLIICSRKNQHLKVHAERRVPINKRHHLRAPETPGGLISSTSINRFVVTARSAA